MLATAIVLGVVVADQLSKLWAVRALADVPVSIIGDDVSFELTRNTGSVFSLFQAFTPLLALIAIGVAVLLVREVRRSRDTLMIVGLSLVLGGALGNLADRLFRSPGFLKGAVVDFVHVGRFPTFNVADSAITIGAVLIVIWAIRADLADRGPPVTEEFVVPESLAGERLDRTLAMLTGWSRSEVQALVEAGSVLVDGAARVAKSRRLEEHDLIEVLAEPEAPGLPRPDPAVPVVVRYEDDDVVVIAKPAGLVVHPGAGHPDATLVNGLLARYPELATVGDPARPGIVHRLDRDTSGLLVVARTAAAYDGLVEMLAAHDVERRYVALVWGTPSSSRGVIDAPIGRSVRRPTRMAVREGGRGARTAYEVVASYRDPEVSLLQCRLETGRTHQIRVHLQAINHPVVGDPAYGGRRAALTLDRPFLHAGGLAFAYPVTGAPIEVEEPLAPELQAVLSSLG